MADVVATEQPKTREKATGRVVFRVTPTQAYLVKHVVEDMAKSNRAHNLTDAMLWLVEHYADLQRANELVDTFKARRDAENKISALL